MTMTYGRSEVRRGYFTNASACAGAREIFNGPEITSRNLLTSPRRRPRRATLAQIRRSRTRPRKEYGTSAVRQAGLTAAVESRMDLEALARVKRQEKKNLARLNELLAS